MFEPFLVLLDFVWDNVLFLAVTIVGIYPFCQTGFRRPISNTADINGFENPKQPRFLDWRLLSPGRPSARDGSMEPSTTSILTSDGAESEAVFRQAQSRRRLELSQLRG